MTAMQIFDKTKLVAPAHYLRRSLNKKDTFGHSNWMTREWGPLAPMSFAKAEQLVKSWSDHDPAWEYKLPLHCARCYHTCNETYSGIGLEAELLGKHVCVNCHTEGCKNIAESQMKKKTNTGWKKMLPKLVPVKPEHQPGDVWKLPIGNSPMWTEQWACQGSGKSPYVVSRKINHAADESMSESWACSCMNWTRTMPRQDCKHILKIKLAEKIPTTTKVAGLTAEQQKSFEKWQLEQATEGKEVNVIAQPLKLFGTQGRKFR